MSERTFRASDLWDPGEVVSGIATDRQVLALHQVIKREVLQYDAEAPIDPESPESSPPLLVAEERESVPQHQQSSPSPSQHPCFHSRVGEDVLSRGRGRGATAPAPPAPVRYRGYVLPRKHSPWCFLRSGRSLIHIDPGGAGITRLNDMVSLSGVPV